MLKLVQHSFKMIKDEEKNISPTDSKLIDLFLENRRDEEK